MFSPLVERCNLTPKDIINGTYRVEKLLGEGTFGLVYKVRHISEGKDYALKLLKLWMVSSEERLVLQKRFDREYETGRIHSNYLVHSVDKGILKGNPYIVMEFCSNGDLENAVMENKVDLAYAGDCILRGLGDLHSQGKVHRDLKPANVLIKDNGEVVLTDFGIAGDQNNRLTQRGIFGTPKELFGTYAYMPPEQLHPKGNNATVLPTTDIFSFGVMMYELICGFLPFGNLDSEADLVTYTTRAKNGTWDKSRLLNKKEGKEWERLIVGCLEPDFKKRLQNSADCIKLLPLSKREYNLPKTKHHLSQSNISLGSFASTPTLRIMQGEEYGRTYNLSEFLKFSKIITIGREDTHIYNMISVKETESFFISRCHCCIEYNSATNKWLIRDGQWRISCPIGLKKAATNPCSICKEQNCGRSFDFQWKNSTNGTYVNSTEVYSTGIVMKNGDIISIGDVKIRIEGI